MENPHLNILVQLAKVDGETDESELALLKEIGRSENLSDVEIDSILSTSEASDRIPSLESLSSQEKSDLMYNLVLMMRADGKVLKDEMKFCIKVVKKLGYREIALFELVSLTYSNPELATDKEGIRKKLKEYKV